jgi:hypothetical protein
MAMKRFSRQLHVMVTPELQQMLEDLAQAEHVTPSDVVRRLIRETHTARFGVPVPPKPKATKRKTSRG